MIVLKSWVIGRLVVILHGVNECCPGCCLSSVSSSFAVRQSACKRADENRSINFTTQSFSTSILLVFDRIG